MLIFDNFAQYAKLNPQKLCLSQGTHQLSWESFVTKVDILASQLATQIKVGDYILIQLASPIDALIYFYATIKVGGIATLIDIKTTDMVINALMKKYNFSLIINEHYSPSQKTKPLPLLKGNPIFLGALSSGTTGIPKIINRDHQSWVRTFPYQDKLFNLSNKDRLYIAGALSYTANLNACAHLLADGGTIFFAANSQPKSWLSDILVNKITAIFMVPANYKMFLRTKPPVIPEVTSLVSGGAKIDATTIIRLIKVFPQAQFTEYYGASELGYVTYATAQDVIANPTSVGKPFPMVQLTIKDDIIWVRSPFLAFPFQPETSIGDLGKIDELGYVYLLGRQNGIINTGGVKIIPEQMEQILLQYPGIKAAAVAGIPDDMRGEKLCLWIETDSSSNLNKSQILAFCKQKMQLVHCAAKIIFLEKLPLNISGKTDKQLLYQMINDGGK